METLFPLYVFPEGALASSVITTVLVGVWVTVFFNLRFGWVLSGLVVPGYLTPLILLEPISAAVVLIEAILTYGLVRAFAVTFAGAIGWTTFFGRDRFFALILASICVRLMMDVLILPPIGTWLNDHYSLGFDWRRSLESFGLIIIALYANQFWKPGLVAGLLTSSVTIGLTLLIVRFGLMEFTNFRISDIGYLYELLAASLLASPKAYIILITTAFIASHLNLRAGLDFNGLLIPALIALQWYEPSKIATSVAEAFVILIASSLAMRLPFFANRTIEGGRKLLLFFNISYLWKILLGYGILISGIEFKTADAFGFGYLLSTLIALKLHDKGGEARMITALTVVSAQGALLGTGIGFALSEGARAFTTSSALPESPAGPSLYDQRRELRPQDERTAPIDDLDALVIGLRSLNDGLHREPGDLSALSEARRQLALTGYAARSAPDGLVTVEKALSGEAGTTITINPVSQSDLVLSVPRGAGLRGVAGLSRALLLQTEARAVVVEGEAEGGQGGSFHRAHTAFGGGILQISGIDKESAQLEVSGRFPAGFDLVELENMIGPVELISGRDARDSAERALARSGFATLALSQEMAYRIIAASSRAEATLTLRAGGLAGYLRQSAAVTADVPAPDALLPSDLLYAEAEVLVPLLGELLPMLRTATGLNEGAKNRLVALDLAAGRIGYSLRLVSDPEGSSRHLVLSSDSSPFGTFAFSAADAEPVFVHVPTGLRDARTHAFGTLLFDRLDAAAILVAGTNERDGRTTTEFDMMNPDREPGLYDLVSKLLIASVPEDSVSVVLRNVVARDDHPLPDADVVLSEDRLVGEGQSLPRIDQITAELDELGLDVIRHDGSSDLAGFEPGVLPQAGYLTARPEAAFLSLWLTPKLRAAFADQNENASEAALFRALDIPTRRLSVESLGGTCFGAFDPSSAAASEMIAAIDAYTDQRNPVALQVALSANADLSFERLVDPDLGQSFLVVRSGNCVTLLVNLHPLRNQPVVLKAEGALDAARIRDFAEKRRSMLYVGDEQI